MLLCSLRCYLGVYRTLITTPFQSRPRALAKLDVYGMTDVSTAIRGLSLASTVTENDAEIQQLLPGF